MPTKEEILKEPDIADYLNKNRGLSKEIERAAEKLQLERDAIPALKKLFSALSEKVVSEITPKK